MMARIPPLAPLDRDATREEIAADLARIRTRCRASRGSVVILLAGIAVALLLAAAASLIQ